MRVTALNKCHLKKYHVDTVLLIILGPTFPEGMRSYGCWIQAGVQKPVLEPIGADTLPERWRRALLGPSEPVPWFCSQTLLICAGIQLLDLGPISTSESPFSLQQRWWKTFYLPPRVVVWINVMMSIKGLCSVWNTVNARKAKLILNPTIKITHYLLCTRPCSECFICISALQISIITSEESATSKGTHLHLQVAKLGFHPACPCLCLNHSGCHWEDRSH